MSREGLFGGYLGDSRRWSGVDLLQAFGSEGFGLFLVFRSMEVVPVSQFYAPELSGNSNSPFARDENDQLIRRSFWLDMSDRSVIMALTQGVGANLSNDHKRAHLGDIGRQHLRDDICVQEILPPK
jgi:hypothetical protein